MDLPSGIQPPNRCWESGSSVTRVVSPLSTSIVKSWNLLSPFRSAMASSVDPVGDHRPLTPPLNLETCFGFQRDAGVTQSCQSPLALLAKAMRSALGEKLGSLARL